jgi:peptide deformylase
VAEIRIYGDPILRKKAQPVSVFDDNLKAFLAQLTIDMQENDGVGLAAPQVGQSIRAAVVDITLGEQPPILLVNPRITWSSTETEDDEEGCLSVPDIRLKVTRPASVTVHALDGGGKEFIIEKAEGFLARALQHEIDHLDGVLFVDRAAPIYRTLASGKLKKMAKSQRESVKPIKS